METKLIQEFYQIKGEMKIISKTLVKLEEAMENQAVLLEKQNVANNRIKGLEDIDKNFEKRLRTLEHQWIKVYAIATTLSTIIGFILSKIL